MCASASLKRLFITHKIPTITALINNVSVTALVDTGATVSIVTSGLCKRAGLNVTPADVAISVMQEHKLKLDGEVTVPAEIAGIKCKIDCVVSSSILGEFQMLIGNDDIDQQLGGVYVKGSTVRFGKSALPEAAMTTTHHTNDPTARQSCMACEGQTVKTTLAPLAAVQDDRMPEPIVNEREVIADVDRKSLSTDIKSSDFTASFDGDHWTMRWIWKDKPPILTNKLATYGIRDEKQREQFNATMQDWIDKGLMSERPSSKGEREPGIIPIICVYNEKKGKVRPCLDLRVLNEHIVCNPGWDVSVTNESIREWRLNGKNCTMLDLSNAFMQIHLHEDLRKYLTVKFKGKYYTVNRMPFGLAPSSKVMVSVIRHVLDSNDKISTACFPYIDDILVNENIVSVQEVKQLLTTFGLATKDPVPIEDSKALGIRIIKRNGVLHWSRGEKLPQSIPYSATKRDVFSVAGKMTSFFQVVGWLGLSTSYAKRQCTADRWNDPAGNHCISMINEILQQVSLDDPVRGLWCVKSSDNVKLWCDASKIGKGAALEIDGDIVEDMVEIVKKQEAHRHINMLELEAVQMGLRLAIAWKAKHVELMVDSRVVELWLRALFKDTKKPKIRGMDRALVERRLFNIRDTLEAYNLTIEVTWIPSEQNKADALSRVPNKWVVRARKYENERVLASTISPKVSVENIKCTHDLCHSGIDATIFLCQQKFAGCTVDKDLVQTVVKNCNRCQSIDPAPVRWERGTVEVDEPWTRLACDITYFDKIPYLTMTCCSSRYSIWRQLKSETAQAVIAQLYSVLQERGYVYEILCDHGSNFVSQEMRDFCKSKGINLVPSCVYRSGGNGIAERNHRTVKRMAARSGSRPQDVIVYYNGLPRKNGITPIDALSSASFRMPSCFDSKSLDERVSKNPLFQIGQKVFVKKAKRMRCDDEWRPAVITAIVNDISVKVDNERTIRHIADIRARNDGDDAPAPDDDPVVVGGQENGPPWLFNVFPNVNADVLNQSNVVDDDVIIAYNDNIAQVPVLPENAVQRDAADLQRDDEIDPVQGDAVDLQQINPVQGDAADLQQINPVQRDAADMQRGNEINPVVAPPAPKRKAGGGGNGRVFVPSRVSSRIKKPVDRYAAS